jgi:hypothetical protein
MMKSRAAPTTYCKATILRIRNDNNASEHKALSGPLKVKGEVIYIKNKYQAWYIQINGFK